MRSHQTSHLDELCYIRYLDKLRVPISNNVYIEIPDPYLLTDGWTSDVAEWPSVTFGDVYSYLIDSPGVYTRETMKAYKSLEAYSYLPFVETVLYNNVEADCPACVLKARIKPSQRVSDKSHETLVIVRQYRQLEVVTAHAISCLCHFAHVLLLLL